LTLDNTLVNTLISAALAVGNGWLIVRHKALQARLDASDEKHNKHALALEKVKADIRVEVAERQGMGVDISRVESALGTVNEKLDRLLQGSGK
jgi:hypothetical protein